MKRHLILLFLIAVASPLLYGQYGLHLQFAREHLASQQFQPANILFQPAQKFAVGSDVGFWAANNNISFDALLLEDNFVSEEAKQEILDQLNGSTQFQAGFQAAYGHVNVRIKDQLWSFSFRDKFNLGLGFENPNTAGLILEGNADYAGQTVSDDDVRFHLIQYHELAIGRGFQWGKIKAGVHAKLLAGRNMVQVDPLSYSLFTESDGSQIDLTGDFAYADDQPASGYPTGFGGVIDMGIIYEYSEKITFQASILDVGAISWDSRELTGDESFSYEGFDLGDLIGDDGSGDFVFIADTLENTFVIDSQETRITTVLPTRISLGGTYQLNEKSQLLVSLHSGLTSFAPSLGIPLLHLGYDRKLKSWLNIGGSLYGGGGDLYGVGLHGRAGIPVGEDKKIGVILSADNVLGLVIPSISRGISLNGGLSFTW
ncbi:MAG: DUF5723 family protein [Bacteroidota bacterium]